MIKKSAEKDVVCPVGGDLLVRFKQDSGTSTVASGTSAGSSRGTGSARVSDFQKKEKDVSVRFERFFVFEMRIHVRVSAGKQNIGGFENFG